MTIRVLVADDQALVRGSFRILVDTAPDLTSVGEAATGTEAVEIARREKPDVVLMDIRMPDMDGIEATREITAARQTSAEEFTKRPESPRPAAAAIDEVTEREREVLTLVGLGLSNTEIAARLHVSLSTAKTHVGRLLTKLGARDRAQLVIAAYNTGLVRPQ
jgi:DNA-binding NarL/FixJ family response regulator